MILKIVPGKGQSSEQFEQTGFFCEGCKEDFEEETEWIEEVNKFLCRSCKKKR
jgi:hypothetical protein